VRHARCRQRSICGSRVHSKTTLPVDGAGMAFGVISTTFLPGSSLAPAHASAVIRLAEVFPTGASAISQVLPRNVNQGLVIKLAAARAGGAITGAHVLSNIDARVIRPLVAICLFVISFFILLRTARAPPPRNAPGRGSPLEARRTQVDRVAAERGQRLEEFKRWQVEIDQAEV
jgi:uncharacterized membrane protein YfcA